MVDYSLCVCYGFVVNGDTLDKIENRYDFNDEIEEFVEDYVRCVDSWTGDEYFIGLHDSILQDNEQMRFIDDGIDVSFEPSEIDNFKNLLTKFKIAEIIGEDLAKCRKMLIVFCY